MENRLLMQLVTLSLSNLFLPIFILFSIFGIVIGFFLAFNPQLAIELQRRFYAKINWRIEPISPSLEIRNTRLMGWFLILLCIATLVFLLTNRI